MAAGRVESSFWSRWRCVSLTRAFKLSGNWGQEVGEREEGREAAPWRSGCPWRISARDWCMSARCQEVFLFCFPQYAAHGETSFCQSAMWKVGVWPAHIPVYYNTSRARAPRELRESLRATMAVRLPISNGSAVSSFSVMASSRRFVSPPISLSEADYESNTERATCLGMSGMWLETRERDSIIGKVTMITGKPVNSIPASGINRLSSQNRSAKKTAHRPRAR